MKHPFLFRSREPAPAEADTANNGACDRGKPGPDKIGGRVDIAGVPRRRRGFGQIASTGLMLLGYSAWVSSDAGLTPAAAPSPAPSSMLAPGYAPLDFAPPIPGTYVLPLLGPAGDGRVVESNGTETRLKILYGDKIILLSLIYSTCNDVNGCPLATSVLQRIQAKLADLPEVRPHIRFLTLSFDPEQDSPKVMDSYGRGFREQGFDWHFLTTRSEADLQPILGGFQQQADQEYGADRQPTGRFSHLLRVFLIDRQARIRNVYTVSVLHPDLAIADIQTLLLDDSSRAKVTPRTAGAARPGPERLGEGDDRTGYERADYQTASRALSERKGRRADLFKLAQRAPLGLPRLPVPKENPLTPSRIELGRRLFYDRRLSLNNTLSCAMCHIPEQGFTSREQATAIGIEGRTVRRNAPTIYNVGYLERLFHDGRETALENQVWGPLLAANEMANPSIGVVIEKITRLSDYRGLFQHAFGRGPSMETVGQALAAYERTLVSGNSPFDRWRYGGQAHALSEPAQRGFALFSGKARCANCHGIGPRTALFTDQKLHNTGIGYRESMRQEPEATRVQVVPGVTFDVGAGLLAQLSEPRPGDLGLYEITRQPADRWKYKTPGLRNVALTAPYMHNGAFATLREVVEFYSAGGVPNEGLDSAIEPLALNDTEIDAVVEFLMSLTGDNIETLVLDAYAAPVGDPR